RWGRRCTQSSTTWLIVQASPRHVAAVDGCHPSGPSKLLDRRDTSLQDWLAANPQLAGGSVAAKDGLPFLFKVLAVAKPLSIQAHPDKALAGRLQRQQRRRVQGRQSQAGDGHRVDSIQSAVRLSSASQIAGYCEQLTDQLGPVVWHRRLAALRAAPDRAKEAIRLAYSNLMRQPESAVKACLDSLLALGRWPIHADFPGDIGCLSVFFMNLIELQPGEAIFLAANLPHAYLSGDCIECMACSDNVLKDVDTLLSMLDYEGDQLTRANSNLASGVASYAPPVPEFCVVRLCGTGTQGELTPPPLPPTSPGILICTAGSGRCAPLWPTGGQTAERTVNVGGRVVCAGRLSSCALLNLFSWRPIWRMRLRLLLNSGYKYRVFSAPS
uniref:PMI_typeI_cat domain-containing protein n=1 Tax=Macrostomum lignano TaxID=282301 RepID=A0A1I8F9S7_9PLAT